MLLQTAPYPLEQKVCCAADFISEIEPLEFHLSDVKAQKKAKHLKCSLSANTLEKMWTYVGT